MAEHVEAPTAGLKRIGKTLRGYDRRAVEELLVHKENELETLRDELLAKDDLLASARSERSAFVRSLEVAAKAADELLEDAAGDAEAIRREAEAEAEALRADAAERAQAVEAEAGVAASEIVAVAKADIAELEEVELARIEAAGTAAAQIAHEVETDKAALARYQEELSTYLQHLGQYLLTASANPTIALPISEQPALAAPVDSEVPFDNEPTIDLADKSSRTKSRRRKSDRAKSGREVVTVASEEIDPQANEFAEFFSDDIDHDKSRDWILRD